MKTMQEEREANLEFCRKLQDSEDFHCRLAEDFHEMETFTRTIMEQMTGAHSWESGYWMAKEWLTKYPKKD